MRLRWFILIILTLLPAVASAEGLFTVEPEDKSMQYLAAVFGNIPALPLNIESPNFIFQQLVHKLNIVVFTLGIIIIIYTTLVGTISTAQEGEVLGKKWSTIFIPARIGIGMYLLLPAAGSGGYSYLQIAVLWLIVQGVGAANAIWREIILDPAGTQEDTRQARLKSGEEIVKNMLKSAICMEYFNTDTALLAAVGSEGVHPFRSENNNAYMIGRESRHPGENPVCGGFYRSSYSNLGADEDTAREVILGAIDSAFWAVFDSAFEAARIDTTATPTVIVSDSPDSWQAFDYLPMAVSILENAVAGLRSSVNLDSFQQEAITNGWIHAGSYYFNLIQATGGSLSSSLASMPGMSGAGQAAFNADVQIAYIPPDESVMDQLTGGRANELMRSIDEIIISYVSEAETRLDPVDVGDRDHANYEDLGFTTEQSQVGGDASRALDAIFGSFFKDAAATIGEYIHNRFADPIVSIAAFGTDLITIAESIWIGALITIVLVWMLTSIMCCMQPLCHTMNFVLAVILPLAGLILAIVWVEGVIMALYIPMIPYLVFTFAALSWIILVIEAFLAAPLIGLSLVIPSEDELGKTTTGIAILFGVFMRPPLMIVGFLFAMKLVLVVFAMLSFGFGATMQYSVKLGIGVFGFIAVIMLYTGMAAAVVHECFSLIYKLPDKCMKWIGVQGGGGDEGGKVKALRGSVEKGAGVGQKAMSGTMGAAQSMTGVGKGGGGGGGKSAGV